LGLLNHAFKEKGKFLIGILVIGHDARGARQTKNNQKNRRKHKGNMVLWPQCAKTEKRKKGVRKS